MRKQLILTALMAAGLIGAPVAAGAQSGPVRVGISGGASFPLGAEFSEEAGTGYHVQGSLGFAPATLPVALRADLLWQEFPDEAGGHFREVGGLGSAILALPLGLARPYLIGGAGAMRLDSPAASHGGHSHAAEAETTLAYAVGGGVEFPFLGLTGVLEARYFAAGDEHRGVPVSFGIRF